MTTAERIYFAALAWRHAMRRRIPTRNPAWPARSYDHCIHLVLRTESCHHCYAMVAKSVFMFLVSLKGRDEQRRAEDADGLC